METGNFDDSFELVGSSITTEDVQKPETPAGVDKQIDDTQSSVVKTPETPTVPKSNESVQVPDSSQQKKPEMIELKEDVILKRLGETFREKGIDVEMPDNVDADTFVNILSNSIFNKEISDPDSPVVKGLIERFADENGVDETTLSIASGIAYGVDRKEFSNLIELQDFANTPVDLSDTDSLRDLFYTYHTLNGISEEAAIEYTDTDVANADLDLVERRQQAIFDFASLGLQEIERTVEQRKLAEKQYKEERIHKINDFYKKLEVAGQKFTKEEFDSYLDATTKKTEKVVYPNGVEAMVTKFDKKRFEEGRDNFENALLQNMLFWLGKKDLKQEKKNEQNLLETRGKFMNGLVNDLKNNRISDASVGYKKEKEDDDVMVVSSSFQ